MTFSGAGKKKPGSAKTATQKPTHGAIWVAKNYPSWQAAVMTHLSKEYENGRVPDNKSLASSFAKMSELKKYQKKLMPFVQAVKERVAAIGVERGLRQTSEFDEIEVLRKNFAYLTNSLEVSKNIHHVKRCFTVIALFQYSCPFIDFCSWTI